MKQEKTRPHLTPTGIDAAERRKARLAAALRANLRRRKVQSQGRHKSFALGEDKSGNGS